MTEPRELVLLSRAEKVLTQANTVDEVKDLRDKAVAVKAYAKKAKIGHRIVIEAATIKLRAERRLGQMLQAIELADAAPGNQYTGRKGDSDDEKRIYLQDLGITKSDSSRTQRLAALPEEVFDRYLTDNIQADREPTMAGLLRLSAQSKPASSDSQETQTVRRAHAAIADFTGSETPFSAVYAEPPWLEMHDQQGGRTVVDNGLTFDELCSLPVRNACSEAAHLHVRATNATLLHAIDLMDAWGFSYGSCLVTVHRTPAAASYWQDSHAFVLLGVRGRLPFLKRDVPSWVEFGDDRTEGDSAMIRQLIEIVSPGPYLQILGSRGSTVSPAWVVLDDLATFRSASRPEPHATDNSFASKESTDGM